jgi:prepilin-type N-terminal cleavage/methylation domain-containing protein
MKPSPKTFPKVRPSGFTLIELLVVITIIAILAGLLFPVIGAVMEHTRKVQAINDETQILSAVNAYYTEYGKYPVDPATKPGDAVYSTDNNQLFDVLRNMTGTSIGNPLNTRGVVYLTVSYASNQKRPVAGVLASTGVWYDPWGSPYNVALDGNYDGQLNSPTPLPNFYSDTGPLQFGVIAWSFGKNGLLGGGPAASSNFGNESGTAGKQAGSGDVVSWLSK